MDIESIDQTWFCIWKEEGISVSLLSLFYCLQDNVACNVVFVHGLQNH